MLLNLITLKCQQDLLIIKQVIERGKIELKAMNVWFYFLSSNAPHPNLHLLILKLIPAQ